MKIFEVGNCKDNQILIVSTDLRGLYPGLVHGRRSARVRRADHEGVESRGRARARGGARVADRIAHRTADVEDGIPGLDAAVYRRLRGNWW